MSNIVIIIPAFQEYENLEFLLPLISNSILENFADHSVNVIIVDSVEFNSKTKILCEENNFIYLNRKPENSFGDAIRSGFSFIIENLPTTKWVIVMDSDGSHDPSLFKNFNKFINDNSYDVVIASRYVEGGSTDNHLFLILLSKIVNIFYKYSFNLKIKDISNNYRLYRYSCIQNINLVEKNFDIVEEILIKLVKSNKNLKIIEIPTKFSKRKFGKSKRNLVTFSLTYLKSIMRLRLHIK